MNSKARRRVDAPPDGTAVILNTGGGAWALAELAENLARVTSLSVSETPGALNYVLGWDESTPPPGQSFIPFESVLLASDKRLLAEVFAQYDIATPRTMLVESEPELRQIIARHNETTWVLKWPTGCGASGHRLMTQDAPLPDDWPRPFVLQEFVRMEHPEVYRLYAVVGETFGWNVRRFPPGRSSPFVAHAQGARYEDAGSLPPAAERQARRALAATGLLDSFGCADLLRDANGNWLVLEVNTDGPFNGVDRDIALPEVADELNARLGRAVRAWVELHQVSQPPH